MKTTNIIIRKSIDPSWPRWAVSGKVADTQWFKTLEAAEKYAGFKFVEPVSELATLRVENKKLRAALEKAAKVLALGFNPGGDEDTILMMRSTLQHAANECAGALAKEIAP